jgi:hypothetical protein
MGHENPNLSVLQLAENGEIRMATMAVSEMPAYVSQTEIGYTR